MEGSLEQLLTLLQHMQIISYFHVASLALWVFEHSITMHLEISYIWRSSHWSIVQIMYLVVRYGAYIDISLNVVVQCFPSLSVRSWILLPGMTAVEAPFSNTNPSRLGRLEEVKKYGNFIICVILQRRNIILG
ncbi:hypothetical protein BDQ17DRAFT_1339118 [Cyathus striatus]|nr:hypothetical protein BDQ17DRAFT_1339118 [Cyathus striatus]